MDEQRDGGIRYLALLFNDCLILSRVRHAIPSSYRTRVAVHQTTCSCPQVNNGVHFVDEEPIVLRNIERLLSSSDRSSESHRPLASLDRIRRIRRKTSRPLRRPDFLRRAPVPVIGNRHRSACSRIVHRLSHFLLCPLWKWLSPPAERQRERSGLPLVSWQPGPSRLVCSEPCELGL